MKRLILLLAALCLLCGCAAPAEQTPPADDVPAAAESEAPADENPGDEAPEDESAPVVTTDDSPPVLTCGDYVMTSAQFQYFFGHQYAAILDTYGDGAFDPAQDLTAQSYDESQSWADFLIDQALGLAEQTERLCLAAKDAGGVGPFEVEIPTDEYARSQGYADLQAMLEALYGDGASFEGYSDFARDMSVSAAYTARLSAGNDHTDAEIEAYYDEHAADYETVFGIEKTDAVPVDVRIIRFYPDDPASAADWQQAEKRAGEVEAEFLKNPSDDAFAALADAHTEDFKSPEGGLYPGLGPDGEGPLADWLFPAEGERAAGDTALIRESDALALCYISALGDRPYWQIAAERDLRRDDYLRTLETLRQTYVFERHPENIDLRVPTAHDADRFDGVEAVG